MTDKDEWPIGAIVRVTQKGYTKGGEWIIIGNRFKGGHIRIALIGGDIDFDQMWIHTKNVAKVETA